MILQAGQRKGRNVRASRKICRSIGSLQSVASKDIANVIDGTHNKRSAVRFPDLFVSFGLKIGQLAGIRFDLKRDKRAVRAGRQTRENIRRSRIREFDEPRLARRVADSDPPRIDPHGVNSA